MSSKDRSFSVSPGTVLSVFCLLLYSAGFIRNELKFGDYDQRLMAVEEVIPKLKEYNGEMVKASNEAPAGQDTDDDSKHQRFKRGILGPMSSNDSHYIKQVLEDLITTSLKICETRGNFNVCPRGRPGPPGRAGNKGDKGKQGKRGRKGSQGAMGPPGRSGKQGIMGPPGIRGEKGIKGDIGRPGIPGIKGEPGESISAPKVRIFPASQLTVNETNTVVLFCSTTSNPTAQISWTRVNGSLPSNRTKVASDGQLHIKDVRLKDAGEYRCVATNILGSDEKVSTVIVNSKPKLSLPLGPSYVEKNKDISLPECRVTSFPPAVITWSKPFGEMAKARVVFNDGRLSITNAQKRDSGLYKCTAVNILGHDSAVTQLVVIELPQFTISPPSQLKAVTNQNITVPCEATGYPQPTVTWRKENGVLPLGRSKVSVNGILLIWDSRQEDSGRYTCMASSNEVIAKAMSTMTLTVVTARDCSEAPSTTGVYQISLNRGSELLPVYCDQTTDGGGWTMVFKFVGGNIPSPTGYQLWTSSKTVSENVIAALDTTSTHRGHYKNRIVQNWQAFNPREARVVLYTGGKEVASLKFNVAGTDNMNWFSQNKLVQSPWADLKSAKNLLNFAISGACCSRGFEIMANYGGCQVDNGWLLITGSVCSWETKHPVPSILYSKQSHATNWHTQHGVADVMIVYIR